MQNWMLKLESRMDPEMAQITIQAVAAIAIAVTFVAGNWHLLVQ